MKMSVLEQLNELKRNIDKLRIYEEELVFKSDEFQTYIASGHSFCSTTHIPYRLILRFLKEELENTLAERKALEEKFKQL